MTYNISDIIKMVQYQEEIWEKVFKRAGRLNERKENLPNIEHYLSLYKQDGNKPRFEKEELLGKGFEAKVWSVKAIDVPPAFQEKEYVIKEYAIDRDTNEEKLLEYVKKIGVFLGTTLDKKLCNVTLPACAYSDKRLPDPLDDSGIRRSISMIVNGYSIHLGEPIPKKMGENRIFYTIYQECYRKTLEKVLARTVYKIRRDEKNEKEQEKIAILLLSTALCVNLRIEAGWKDKDWKAHNTVVNDESTSKFLQYDIRLIDQTTYSPYDEFQKGLSKKEKRELFIKDTLYTQELTPAIAPTRRLVGVLNPDYNNPEWMFLKSFLKDHKEWNKEWKRKTGYDHISYSTEYDDPEMISSEFLKHFGLYRPVPDINPNDINKTLEHVKGILRRRKEFLEGKLDGILPGKLNNFIPIFKKAMKGNPEYTMQDFLKDVTDTCDSILPDLNERFEYKNGRVTCQL